MLATLAMTSGAQLALAETAVESAVSLRVDADGDDSGVISGRVTSDRYECEALRRVWVLIENKGRYVKLGSDTTDSRGRWTVRITFIANGSLLRAKAKPDSTFDFDCLPDSSPVKRVTRGG